MVLHSNDRKTYFSLKMPNFCTTFLYQVAQMSENKYLHVLCRACPQVFETYVMLPQLIIGSEE